MFIVSASFLRAYAPAARRLLAKRTAVEGPQAIAAFFAGGVSRVLLRFTPEQRIVSDTLVYEAGVCHDPDRATEALRERCHYAVVLVRSGDHWLIQSHGWGTAI